MGPPTVPELRAHLVSQFGSLSIEDLTISGSVDRHCPRWIDVGLLWAEGLPVGAGQAGKLPYALRRARELFALLPAAGPGWLVCTDLDVEMGALLAHLRDDSTDPGWGERHLRAALGADAARLVRVGPTLVLGLEDVRAHLEELLVARVAAELGGDNRLTCTLFWVERDRPLLVALPDDRFSTLWSPDEALLDAIAAAYPHVVARWDRSPADG